MKYRLIPSISPTLIECRGSKGSFDHKIRYNLTTDIYFTIRSQLFGLDIYQQQMERCFLTKFGYNRSRRGSGSISSHSSDRSR
jgi:hypothetical protein